MLADHNGSNYIQPIHMVFVFVRALAWSFSVQLSHTCTIEDRKLLFADLLTAEEIKKSLCLGLSNKGISKYLTSSCNIWPNHQYISTPATKQITVITALSEFEPLIYSKSDENYVIIIKRFVGNLTYKEYFEDVAAYC